MEYPSVEERIADALERVAKNLEILVGMQTYSSQNKTFEHIADSLEKLVDYKIKVASGQVIVPTTQSNKLNIPDAVEQAMLGNIGSHD